MSRGRWNAVVGAVVRGVAFELVMMVSLGMVVAMSLIAMDREYWLDTVTMELMGYTAWALASLGGGYIAARHGSENGNELRLGAAVGILSVCVSVLMSLGEVQGVASVVYAIEIICATGGGWIVRRKVRMAGDGLA